MKVGDSEDQDPVGLNLIDQAVRKSMSLATSQVKVVGEKRPGFWMILDSLRGCAHFVEELTSKIRLLRVVIINRVV